MRTIEELRKILTKDECEAIYRMLEDQYRCDDVRAKILDAFEEAEGCGESLCVGEGEIFTPAKTATGAILKELYAHPEELAEKTANCLGNNDSYWESYWLSVDYTREDVVEERIKEFLVRFGGLNFLQMPESETSLWGKGKDLRLFATGEHSPAAFLYKHKYLIWLPTLHETHTFNLFSDALGKLSFQGEGSGLVFTEKAANEITLEDIINKLTEMGIEPLKGEDATVGNEDFIVLDAIDAERILKPLTQQNEEKQAKGQGNKRVFPDIIVRHISEIEENDKILYEGDIYIATTEAYLVKTEYGKEWNVEVSCEDGSESYLYAHYFDNGIVEVVIDDENAKGEEGGTIYD